MKVSLNSFNELYRVTFNYKKSDGYWIYGRVEHAAVIVKHGINEKNNHAKAEEFIKSKYPGCQITEVAYC